MLNLTLDSRAFTLRVDAMPPAMQALIKAKVTVLTFKLQAHVVQDKLHGQVLGQRSGRLARSIANTIIATATAVFGRVFSSGDVKYARIWEMGGTIPEHDIYPDKAQALAFMIGGHQVFAKHVHMPARTVQARSFLRSSLADMAEEIVTSLKAAAVQGAKLALKQSA